MKNNKGYTLAELLATIVILGVISAIGVASVSTVLNKAKTNYYEKLEGTIITAARSYYNDHRLLLPNNEIKQRQITLKTLTDNRYLTKVVDYSKNECDLENSYVKVTKEGQKYNYTVNLNCPEYKK